MSKINQKFPLLILTTGGTIEKTYDEGDGSLENRENSGIKALVKGMRLPYLQINTFFLMAKDSLAMTEADRELIYQSVMKHMKDQAPIVVIHGTDTMDLSARYLYEKIPKFSVPVIFTGAMKPFAFADSDARQNVIEALYAARIAAPGVYISFHGRLFPLPNVRKNRELMTFEAF